jgi:ABC-type dipeptide/oligopeptide/nickel transport system ATPase subunit
LDLEGIDALADGIKQFKGGMVLVSHDFRLLQQVADEIWVCDKGKISKWPGDIISYKNHLKKNMKKYVPLSLLDGLSLLSIHYLFYWILSPTRSTCQCMWV